MEKTLVALCVTLVTSPQLTMAEVGRSAVAVGNYVTAEGAGSTAVGMHSHAYGNLSSAYGAHAVASGVTSQAFGSAAWAKGYSMTALGKVRSPKALHRPPWLFRSRSLSKRPPLCANQRLLLKRKFVSNLIL